MRLGVIKVMSVDEFVEPVKIWELFIREGWLNGKEDIKAPPTPGSTGSWPELSCAIRRGKLIVVESATPRLKATLRFVPSHRGEKKFNNYLFGQATLQPEGNYTLQGHPREKTETGRIVQATEVTEMGKEDPQVSLIAHFQYRFIVVTLSDARPQTQRVWVVGVDRFDEFPADADDESE